MAGEGDQVKQTLYIRGVPTEAIDALRELAEKDERSVAAIVRKAILEYLRRRGTEV